MLYWGGLLLAGCAALLLIVAAAGRCRRARRWKRRGGQADAAYRFCPGRSRGFWRIVDLMWPWQWFLRTGCGYDLGGHFVASPTHVRCPECGTESPALRLMRRRRCVRTINVAVVLLAGAATMVCFDPPGARKLARNLPIDALLLLEYALRDRNHEQFHWALMRRARDGALSPRQERWLRPLLIEYLRDDDHGRNAGDASTLLAMYWSHSEPALRSVLESDDGQQRYLAARIIRAHAPRPDDALLEVTVETLRSRFNNDWWLRRTYRGDQALSEFDYVLKWYDEARPFVIDALESDDAQQRLTCAGIVAFAGDDEYIEQAVPLLIDHLRDNRSSRDAMFAAQALYAYGPDIVPLVEHAAASDDAQQRQLAEYVVFQLLPDLTNEFPAPVAPFLGSYRDPLDLGSEWVPTPRVR